MAKELPYFRFTVSEWLNDDISLETYHLQGVFASVCAFYWFQDCSITKAKLKKRFSDAQEEIEELLKLGIIKEGAENFISIKFLDEQFDLLSEKRKKRVEAGRKGGLASAKQRLSNASPLPEQSSSYKDKDKDKDKEYSATELQALGVCEHLVEMIVKHNPDHKYASNPPDIESGTWLKEVDRAIRLDGRSPEGLKNLITYTFTKPTEGAQFWSGNIQSGTSLRKHYDKADAKFKTERENKNTPGNEDTFDPEHARRYYEGATE